MGKPRNDWSKRADAVAALFTLGALVDDPDDDGETMRLSAEQTWDYDDALDALYLDIQDDPACPPWEEDDVLEHTRDWAYRWSRELVRDAIERSFPNERL